MEIKIQFTPTKVPINQTILVNNVALDWADLTRWTFEWYLKKGLVEEDSYNIRDIYPFFDEQKPLLQEKLDKNIEKLKKQLG